MFRKTRNKILLQNMVMISAVVIVAFMVLFATTYTRVRNDNRNKLMRHSVSQMVIPGVSLPPGNAFHARPGITDAPLAADFAKRIPPDAGLSFSVLTDSRNNVMEINSMVDLQEATYAQAARAAMNAPGGNTTIKLENRIWQYAIYPVTIMTREISDSAFAVTTIKGEFNNIRFLDVTDSYTMIRSLAFMLAGLTVVILTAFFFIVRYFADRAIQPMQEAWEKQNRFIADASHELKTPLSIINANCGALYAGSQETVASQVKWVNSIMRAADRMTGLVAGLLSLARMEDVRYKPQCSPFNLSETVADTVNEMGAAALEKGLVINKQIEPGIEIESDPEQFRQVLAILLDNAVKYTASGGAITAFLKKEKRCVKCVIRNSGAGIPAGDISRLFDRFYRGDPARSSENSGYGLGLSIAKALTELLGVQLMVHSKPNEYTDFILLFKTRSW